MHRCASVSCTPASYLPEQTPKRGLGCRSFFTAFESCRLSTTSDICSILLIFGCDGEKRMTGKVHDGKQNLTLHNVNISSKHQRCMVHLRGRNYC